MPPFNIYIMQVKTIKYLVAFLPLLVATSCKKYVESGDVNINPNASSKATLKTLLPALQDATAFNHYLVAYSTSLFSQQMAAYQSGPINDDKNIDVRMGGLLNLYQNAMTNARLLMDLAVKENAPYYSAMGKILMVFNLALATDTYGDVPFSDAFKAPEILYPKYDKQEDIYPAMQKLLDESITEAASTTPGVQIPGKDDLVYGGKMANWIQTAWFLKARLFMHLTKKGAAAAAGSALTALAKAYPSSANDFQLTYNTRNLNPWNANVAKRVATGNFLITPSKRFTEALNGTAYPGLVDPRLPKLMDKKTAPNYVGMVNGVGSGGTVDLTENTYYGKDVTPLMMATYAEQKLMEAEATFLNNGGTVTSTGTTQAGYDAYLAGISAHMDKVGVDATSKSAYLTSSLVAVTASRLTLEHILREKQVALYLQPEAWVDVRRYDYNANLFRGIGLPQNQAPAMNGQFIRRSGYPDDELSRNPNAKAAVKPLTEKVWWDQ
jgi:hypothetical protein